MMLVVRSLSWRRIRMTVGVLLAFESLLTPPNAVTSARNLFGWDMETEPVETDVPEYWFFLMQIHGIFRGSDSFPCIFANMVSRQSVQHDLTETSLSPTWCTPIAVVSGNWKERHVPTGRLPKSHRLDSSFCCLFFPRSVTSGKGHTRNHTPASGRQWLPT